MLANCELYFASSNSFNDPFDCRARKEFEFQNNSDFIKKWSSLEAAQQFLPVEEAKKRVTAIAGDSVARENYVKEKSKQFQKLVLQSFGICSFSEINNDMLMWSHYADSHKGLCLEFSRAPGFILEYARPIEYPENDDFPYIDYWISSTNEQLNEISKIVLTKSRHWDYEKEWRIILPSPTNIENYKGHFFTYPNEMLSGVVFGYRMNENERQTIINILSKHSVDYYEIKPVKNKFLLEVLKNN